MTDNKEFTKSNAKGDDYQIDMIDATISELVYDNYKMLKAYNYYHGKRDADQFRHLEENYGIGTPSAISFTPLVRKHIDVLVGEFLEIPLQPKVSCKDKDTMDNIFRDKQLAIARGEFELLKKHLNSQIYAMLQGQQQSINDKVIEDEIEGLKQNIQSNFISEYEKAGQNIIQYIIQSRDIDLLNKLKIVILDLLIVGVCYYKVIPTASKTGIDIEILNPLNTFIERNPNSFYIKDAQRSVIRKWMSKAQILAKYGNLLDKDGLDRIRDLSDKYVDGTLRYIRSYNQESGELSTNGILAGLEVTPGIPNERSYVTNWKLYPVYEVEWLTTDKDKNNNFTMKRYTGTRIGTEVYVLNGEDETAMRSISNPNVCSLSVNGIIYTDRTGEPYSLVLATANLQDKYDITNFFRDNILANSGTVGGIVDVAHLPTFLGDELPERVMKYLSYRKGGISLIDSSAEGMPTQLNTIYNGFDDTIKAQTIQAFDLVLQRLEETASSITGVFRERIGGIEQKDAVTNVATGIRQSFMVTKQYYHNMDLITREILSDVLNLAKSVYKKGMQGTLILGNYQRELFTALPEHYTLTDYDIHIADSSTIIQEKETLKQLTFEFIKGGLIDGEAVIEALDAKGLTEMKSKVLASIRKRKAESNQIQQADQTIQQLQQQLKESQQQLNDLQGQLNQATHKNLEIENKKLEIQYTIAMAQLKEKTKHEEELVELETKRIQSEILQVYDDNSHNDKIRQD